ncbi:2-oxoglutarate and iron-dependent oxygenase JMJD4 isoform X1 [Acipenser oxyrinchus oxyrinchus]|uniref:2-oxoglutarate and iron-dependent oxygenase JMJD4 n=1 Tax=Acipenser oxyrinchus oxyrinchus TaxID=40147 RepID=A0AAD8LQV5_ACIOX|nr:2-oxoglutarate and iron-dependent oxygenase JMJD4 isoform X1 [Acipenser oxyrinchus oxyrinchus]
MDRETFQTCCSLVKSHRPCYEKLCSSHLINYIEKKDFSYSKFFEKYVLPNYPCVFSGRFTEDWNSRKQWVTQEGKPNFQRLLQDFGDALVPVANCNAKEYNANPKKIIPFKEYVAYWKDYIQNGHSSPKGCLYLKDWHLHREFPKHNVYSTPVFFTSDWLNEYWDAIEVDDYRFVYMGPKGSWTPFHADVFHSYSWSANVCGRKKWLLYPPGQEDNLRDCHGNLVYDVTEPILQDKRQFPRYDKSCQPLEIIQEAGEVIFVPSGWHHQVYNLEDTISINHNWVNSCNVDTMWQYLQRELAAVQSEISEWRDSMDNWHQHCQIMMKSCTGIDYKEFYMFLNIISKNRISFLHSFGGDTGSSRIQRPHDLSTLGPHHAVFDLNKVAQVLECVLSNEEFKKLDRDSLSPRPEDLLQKIKEATEKTPL